MDTNIPRCEQAARDYWRSESMASTAEDVLSSPATEYTSRYLIRAITSCQRAPGHQIPSRSRRRPQRYASSARVTRCWRRPKVAAWRSASRSPAQTPRVTIFGTDSLSTTDGETSGLATAASLRRARHACACGWFGDALRRAILAREPIDPASVYDGRGLPNVKRAQAVALCT